VYARPPVSEPTSSTRRRDRSARSWRRNDPGHGGLGRVFLHTSNPPVRAATAWRCLPGRRALHQHAVRAVPSDDAVRGDERFLISESMRGEGARLVDERGRSSCATTTRTARSRRGTSWPAHPPDDARDGAPCAFLTSATRAPTGSVEFRASRKCREAGIDITIQPIRLSPRRTTAAAASRWTSGTIELHGFARREVSCTAFTGPTASRARRCSSACGNPCGQDAAAAIDRDRRYYLPRSIREARNGAGRPALVTGLLTIRNHVELRRAGAQPEAARSRHQILRELHLEIDVLCQAELGDALIAFATGSRPRSWCCWRPWKRAPARGALQITRDRERGQG